MKNNGKCRRSGMPGPERRLRDRVHNLLSIYLQSDDDWWLNFIDLIYEHYSPEDDDFPITKIHDIVWLMPADHLSKLMGKMVHKIEFDKRQCNSQVPTRS